jgi:segregation and condensation protein A|tara:strand:- start:24202 stop:25029 length:828 start_codon:yes stop_codon:yes gene_type:complete
MTIKTETDINKQYEMPFAVVEGEPVTELPQDLYIPPFALKVFLEAFEGPLDLLLYLIKRQNLNILDIPVTEITQQYIDYINLMEEIKLELAGEYLLMAAMLAEIKSRMLLPRPETLDEEEDPRAELVRRLQEYERFKIAAEELDSLPRLERDIVIANAEAPNKSVVIKLPEVTIKELLIAFHDVLKRVEMNSELHFKKDTLSVRQRMVDIINQVHSKKFIDFIELFNPNEGRIGVAVTFLAILELLKDAAIEVVQNEEFAPMHIRVSSSIHSLDG